MTNPTVLKGNAYKIGVAHGEAFHEVIATNLAMLLDDWHRHGNANWLDEAESWAYKQAQRHGELWPWLRDEMRGIADGSGQSVDRIILLNFRVWQYNIYGAGAMCSSFLGHAADGTLVTGGALDDPRELYGFVDVAPDAGYRFMSFAICGTVWANRGLNEKGLSVGVSSQPLKGLQAGNIPTWQQDICLRVILQECATCDDVLQFCETHRFLMNFVVADATGNHESFTVSPLGVFRFASEVNCLTNHLLSSLHDAHRAGGWDGAVLADTSETRLRSLQDWLQDRDGKFTLDEIFDYLGSSGPREAAVNNFDTAFMTVARPQCMPPEFYVAEKPVTSGGFRRFSFD